jgi:glutathionylspermidine synthase
LRRLTLEPRPDWREKADAVGFVWAHAAGEPYWDEGAAYAFTLEQIEGDLEPAAAELHDLCLDLVDEAVRDAELLERLAIPRDQWTFVADSWNAKAPSLYGRFDFFYDGKGPPKLYEYNADTPTSVFEAAVFQWLWLEDRIAAGALPAGTDQFNSLHEALTERFRTLFPQGGFVHFASDAEAVEDRQTVRYFEDLAGQAGLEPKFVAMKDIGLNKEAQYVDLEGFVLQAAFKLYPWEDMFREPYAPHLTGAGVRWLEPPWKAILSNKGLLPLLWSRHPGHPNLLPAFFEDDPQAASLAAYVRKPLFSREGANLEVVAEGVQEPVLDQGYGADGWIRQAYQPPPDFDGRRPVVGAWIVGAEPAGIGVREDDSVVTKNLARFVPHVIMPET